MSETLPSMGETMSTFAPLRTRPAHLLPLANPLAALRERDVLDLPGQFGGELSMPTRTRFGLSLNAQVCPG